MSNVRALKGTPFSVDFDFPREIQASLGRLGPRLKEIRPDCPMSKVYMLYPTNIMQYGILVCDELPEWDQYVGTRRLAHVDEMDQVKVQHVRVPVQSDQTWFRNAPLTTHGQRNTSSSQSAQSPCDLVSSKSVVVCMDYQQTCRCNYAESLAMSKHTS